MNNKIKKKVLYVIILNYNNCSDTIDCIDSFKKLKSINFKLIVVDNDSDEKCVNDLKLYINQKENITFIETGCNLGYAGGNNVGIKYAISHGAEYIAIVNNDVIINDSSFNSSIEILESDNNVAFVGPAILEFNSDLIQYTGGTINYKKVISPHLNFNKKYVKSDAKIECDYIGGACMLFKASIINEIGYIPEDYFLFWEETEWCSKVKKLGLKCICSMGGYVNHKGSASIRKKLGFESYYLEKNRILFALRNNETFFDKMQSILWIFFYAIVKGILKDKVFLSYIPYYIDGLLGRDKYAIDRNK